MHLYRPDPSRETNDFNASIPDVNYIRRAVSLSSRHLVGLWVELQEMSPRSRNAEISVLLASMLKSREAVSS